MRRECRIIGAESGVIIVVILLAVIGDLSRLTCQYGKIDRSIENRMQIWQELKILGRRGRSWHSAKKMRRDELTKYC